MNREELNKKMFKAAEAGDVYTVKKLLQSGADIHAGDDYALFRAVGSNQIKTVKVLLQLGANINAKKHSSLTHAVYSGHTKIVQILLQAGANSAVVSFKLLKRFFTAMFVLSLSDDIISTIESSHPEAKEYQCSEKIKLLKTVKKDYFFEVKISLADLYYRPGEAGYHRAISF